MTDNCSKEYVRYQFGLHALEDNFDESKFPSFADLAVLLMLPLFLLKISDVSRGNVFNYPIDFEFELSM